MNREQLIQEVKKDLLELQKTLENEKELKYIRTPQLLKVQESIQPIKHTVKTWAK